MMQWSDQQKKVIRQRDRDILVSAAAGSGKTAVLVERIIERVCDSQDPIDIDRILIVTFTRAAAKEMKERIYRALEERVSENPSDIHLMAQTTLIHNAKISTIDGFCQYLVRNYFHEIGLDPGVRVAEEGELVLLQNEIVEEVLEDKYQEADENFLFFTDAFARRDRDDAVIEMIFSLYRESCSYPYPVAWLEEQRKAYAVRNEKQLEESRWMKCMMKHIRLVLTGLSSESSRLLEDLCIGGEEHPYADAVRSDLSQIRTLLSCEDYEALYDAFSAISFAVLSRKKLPDEDPDERAGLQERRNAIKKALSDLKKDLVWQPVSEILEDIAATAPYIHTLVSLTIEFGKRYKRAKEARGVMDFSDLEHYALDILVDEESRERTAAAKQLAEYFSEIMVDEYQDSNYLQEMLLSAITRKEDGRHDYFMVGDVKQSIYRFRQARPKIFIDKSEKFQKGGSNEILIGLEKNFRSRQEVTDSVNAVFEAVMHKDMGGITYDKSQALVCGAKNYPLPMVSDLFQTEILLADDKNIKQDEFENKHVFEATIIAYRIRQLLKNASVTDAKTQTLRPIRLSDIAILHRNANAIGKIYQDTLQAYGIDSQIVSVTGYFSTMEVETVLALLRVLNNPLGDIELVSVMKSPLFSFSDTQLAKIRAAYPKEPFHQAVRHYAMDEEGSKVRSFWETIERWRKQVNVCSIYELLSLIFNETGYLAYLFAMPGGQIRRSNIEKLLELSIAYENTSYKGLFYFVRYIERLQKYELDMGQAGGMGIQEAVSIMTIHKSKGLEYPVVILAGCGQRFRNHTGPMVLHPELGMGLHSVDPEKRTKKNTLFRIFLSRMNLMEERGEELRVLYVAMTRAKEQLIIVAVDREIEKTLPKQGSHEVVVPLHRRLHAKHYLDYILPGAIRYPKLFSIKLLTVQDLVMEETKKQVLKSVKKQELLRQIDAVSEEKRKEWTGDLRFVYPHPLQTDTKVKYSVSELKRRAIAEAFSDEDTKSVFEEKEMKSCIPWFISRKDEFGNPAERGTAIHRYMECFDFKMEDYKHSYEKQKQMMLTSGRLKPLEEALLIEKEIKIFLESDLAGRMHEAAGKGLLEKEAAFVMLDEPSHFLTQAKEDGKEEPILVQGIIDVFFEEEDGIVLLDYKTDRVKDGKELIKRYQKQMMLYADALERTKEKQIKEIILYSFALGRAIMVE